MTLLDFSIYLCIICAKYATLMTVNISINKTMLRLWRRKVPFFIVFFVAVLATLTVLTLVDFVPEEPESDTEVITPTDTLASTETQAAAQRTVDPLPSKIIFDSLDKEVVVLNPTSRSIAELDAALLEGAVRHPDSANFTEEGNMFILAHSSYLPNVLNKNFQAFNGIQKLDWGDTVRVQSGDREYEYFVEKVYMARAEDVVVPETPGEARLTLSTCNSFGAKDDRYIVEAKLVSERAL